MEKTGDFGRCRTEATRLQMPKLATTSHLKNKGLASTVIEASPSVEQDGA